MGGKRLFVNKIMVNLTSSIFGYNVWESKNTATYSKFLLWKCTTHIFPAPPLPPFNVVSNSCAGSAGLWRRGAAEKRLGSCRFLFWFHFVERRVGPAGPLTSQTCDCIHSLQIFSLFYRHPSHISVSKRPLDGGAVLANWGRGFAFVAALLGPTVLCSILSCLLIGGPLTAAPLWWYVIACGRRAATMSRLRAGRRVCDRHYAAPSKSSLCR